MSEPVSRAAGMPGNHPPALAISQDEADAVALAMKYLDHPTEDDRTVMLLAVYRVVHHPSARLAMLADVAIKAAEAARAARGRPRSDGGPGAPGKPK